MWVKLDANVYTWKYFLHICILEVNTSSSNVNNSQYFFGFINSCLRLLMMYSYNTGWVWRHCISSFLIKLRKCARTLPVSHQIIWGDKYALAVYFYSTSTMMTNDNPSTARCRCAGQAERGCVRVLPGALPGHHVYHSGQIIVKWSGSFF